MKILFILPEGNDMSGIIPTAEQHMFAMRELGHRANLLLIRPVKKSGDNSSSDKKFVESADPRFRVHPVYGYRGPFTALTEEGLKEQMVLEYVNSFDGVVWLATYGLVHVSTEGKNFWFTDFFKKITAPQVVMIHDDGVAKRYPWIAQLEPYIVGWACVHDAAMKTAAMIMTKPRALIFSPHDLSSMLLPEKKRLGVISVGRFKPRKRNDRLIIAAPYIRMMGIPIHMCGEGIEERYMKSKDKCKPKYFCTLENDPDATKEMIGNKIWNNAIDAGMMFHGPVSEAQRDDLMKKSKLLIDMSCEKSGAIYNRSTIEGIKNGCVPVANPLSISGKEDGQGEIFKEGYNFLGIEPFDKPLDIADTINSHHELSSKKIKQIVENAQETIKIFDRKIAAEQLIKLLKGKKTGNKYDKSASNSPELDKKSQEQFKEYFGGL